MLSALWSQLLISLSGDIHPFFEGIFGYQIRNEEPDELEYVSRETNDILQNCLAKDYKFRYRASEQVIESLGIGKRGREATVEIPDESERTKDSKFWPERGDHIAPKYKATSEQSSIDAGKIQNE